MCGARRAAACVTRLWGHFMRYETFLLTAFLLLAGVIPAPAQTRRTLPRLKVSDNKRFLVEEDGKPFFYLGDTAWELFHRLTREEAAAYLKLRAQQKFTVIQAVALAEEDGLTDPNAYGSLPLVDLDPTKPAVTPGADPKNRRQYDYWDHIEYIVDEANRQGLYIGLLPTWGAWLEDGRPGKNKVINARNAQAYGEFVGRRFGKKSVIWILGGDRSADQTAAIWRAMARGIAIGVNGKEDYHGLVMGFHPNGGATSSRWFHEDEWLTVNMQQTGHGLAADVRSWERIANDYNKTPTKPVMDAEPLYEDHPFGLPRRRQRLLLRRARPPTRVLGYFLRSVRSYLRRPFGLADVRARAQAHQRTAILLDRSHPPSGRRTDAVRAGADRIASRPQPRAGPIDRRQRPGRRRPHRGHPRRWLPVHL